MPSTIESEIQTLGRIMTAILPDAQELPPPLRVLLSRMVQSPTSGLNAFGTLLQAVKALEPKNVPVEAAKISARDRAAVEAVEAARKQRRKSFWLNIASLTLLFAIVVFIVLKKFVFSNERRIQAMVEIPAGTYPLADGRKVEIREPFWIDKYEVTWAEYHRFLRYLDQHPTSDQDFRHSAMPRFFTHRPENWDIFYGRAAKGLPVHSTPIDLNCPVVEVRWWDAYAFANWLGRELPTADEWEVAASGGKGYKFPWGNEFDPAKANTNSDYQPTDPAAKGSVDGYNFWNPVDKVSGDTSPFGAVGMAGNVAEWTATWTPDKKLLVVKGGSFAQGDPNLSSKMTQDPSTPEEYIGFRTISRTNPKTAQ
ncbi:MAG: SUMF1/EgtB/PvdO family nonheme iron enzyme [Chthoniobacteraceae bacterium]